jgi:hypothetical protein
MTRRTTTALALGLAAGFGVLLLAGGCTPRAVDPDVATVGGTAAAGPGTTVPAKDPREAALDFARCMREHGVDMPDPEVGEDGGIGISIGADAGSADAPAMEAAQEACQPALDAALQQDSRKPDPAEEARLRENALKFAQCMRDHGVDLPDPTFEGGGRVMARQGGPGDRSGPDPDSPVFEEAQKACADLMGGNLQVHRAGPPPAEGGR